MSQDEEEFAALLVTEPDRHFKQLVLTYQHRLYSFMLRQTGSAQDAEDIVQDAFIRAYYALEDYAAQHVQIRNVQPWLYKIALNVFYNRLRTVTLEYTSLDLAEGSALLELEDQAPGPDEEAWLRERWQEIETAVTALPEKYRLVINLYYFEEYSYQEIAALLNKPLGTVKSNIHRGIGLLRRVLSGTERGQVG